MTSFYTPVSQEENSEEESSPDIRITITRHSSAVSEDEIDNLQCLECNKYSFSTMANFENHKKSRKHLQKLRRNRSKVVEEIIDSTFNRHHIIERSNSSTSGQGSISQQQHLEDLNDYNGKIETYRLANKKSFSDGYLSYIHSTIAYWAINMTFNATVKDFSISLGEKAWEPFGNVTVKVQYVAFPEKPAKTIYYIIQLKHVVSSNAITLNSFMEGIFSYEEFMRQIVNVKDIDKETKDTRFYVFTTATIAPNLETNFYIKFCKDCKKLKVACKCKHDDLKEAAFEDVLICGKGLTNERNLLFNTSDDNGSVYPMISFSRKGYKVPPLYMYTSQKPLSEMVKSTIDIFADFIEDVHPRLVRNFIKFVESWTKKYNISRSAKFRMKKEDVLVKLGELLLDQYRVIPKIEKIEDQSTRFAIWVQAIKSADITVTRILNKKLSNLLEPFNILIQNHLKKNIQIASDCDDFEDIITITADEIKVIEDNALKFYISNEACTDYVKNISLNKLYMSFWKAGLMPLTLKVDKSSQNYVFQVINLLKTRGLVRRYLINTTDENIRLSAKTWKNLSFFINLGDIADKLGQNIVDRVKIKLPNGSISLGAIQKTDQFFQKTIFPYEFFEMALDKYQLKIYNYHVEQQELTDKLVLNHDLILLLLQSTQNDEISNSDSIKILHNINPALFAKN